MQVEISLLTPQQAEECARIMASNDPWKKVGRSYEDALSSFTKPEHTAFGLFIDGEMKGFLVLILNGLLGGGFIKSLYVDKEFRGSGLGKKLMTYGESKIFSQFANAYLCVSSFNKNAQLFYQRNGYAIVGELDALIIPDSAEILMRKTMGPTSQFEPPANQ